MKIGFLSAHSLSDRRAWSGIIYYLAASLAANVGEVVPLGPVQSRRERLLRGLDLQCRRHLGKGYDFSHSLYLSAEYARVFEERLRRNPVDVIFAPVASTQIARLKTRIPIVYMSDATIASLIGYYPEFSDLLGISRLEANHVERLAIRKASQVVYTSQWAAESARRSYGAPLSKLHVIPMGANVDVSPTIPAITTRLRRDILRLLFVGVDWERKGGSVAFAALKCLEDKGIRASMTVVGCVPPAGFAHPSMKVVPFLNKADDQDRSTLTEIYADSDVFILPTRAECSPIVMAEAAAFGLPAFASRTGGMESMVVDGITGELLAPDATGKEYADAIAHLWHDAPRRVRMSLASRQHFETTLNWTTWGKSTGEVIRLAARVHNPSK